MRCTTNTVGIAIITTASAVASGLLLYLSAHIQSIEFIHLLLVALVGTLVGIRYLYLALTQVNIFEEANPVVVYPPPQPKPPEDEDPQPPV